jgi:hypothetical protein
MIGKILCRLGFHDWEPSDVKELAISPKRPAKAETCARCGCGRLIYFDGVVYNFRFVKKELFREYRRANKTFQTR